MFLFCWTNDSEIDQDKYLISRPLKDLDDERGAHHLLRLLMPVSPFVTTPSIRSDPSVSGSQNKKRTFS
jgi:hypothetical protein